MPVIDRDTFLSRMTKPNKGFERKEGPKEITLIFTFKGKPTQYRTHCSRGAHGQKLMAFHIHSMAEQLNLTEDELMLFYDCKYYQNDFLRLQTEKKGGDPLDRL